MSIVVNVEQSHKNNVMCLSQGRMEAGMYENHVVFLTHRRSMAFDLIFIEFPFLPLSRTWKKYSLHFEFHSESLGVQ